MSQNEHVAVVSFDVHQRIYSMETVEDAPHVVMIQRGSMMMMNSQQTVLPP
jgi:hypothetical protein